jgi:hypothetical protein
MGDIKQIFGLSLVKMENLQQKNQKKRVLYCFGSNPCNVFDYIKYL